MRHDQGIAHSCRRPLDTAPHCWVRPRFWTDSGSMLFTVVVACLVVAMSSQPAWAYLDPATGSMILQGLIGGLVGALVVGRLYWQKLRHFFSAKKWHFSSSKNKLENDGQPETRAKR